MKKCYLCNSNDVTRLYLIESKPDGETNYGIDANNYFREVCKCNNCSVFLNIHESLPDGFYSGAYNASILDGKLGRRFERIMSFNFKKSDNKHRVLRINEFLYQMDNLAPIKHVLDIGCGTAVFGAEMRKFGWITSCIDPDPAAITNATSVAKIDHAYLGTLDSVEPAHSYDLITFNKVLEHVKDPVKLLAKSVKYLKPNGILYVELPYAVNIVKQGTVVNSSEFFIDHYTIYSEDSLKFLVTSARCMVKHLDIIVDPSGKQTIFAFMIPQN